MTSICPDRRYTRGLVVPFEEDQQHEFKGHRTVCLENRLPHGVVPHHNGAPGGLVNTRQQWSKVSCGHLHLVYMDMDYGQLSMVWTIVHSGSWTIVHAWTINCP